MNYNGLKSNNELLLILWEKSAKTQKTDELCKLDNKAYSLAEELKITMKDYKTLNKFINQKIKENNEKNKDRFNAIKLKDGTIKKFEDCPMNWWLSSFPPEDSELIYVED